MLLHIVILSLIAASIAICAASLLGDALGWARRRFARAQARASTRRFLRDAQLVDEVGVAHDARGILMREMDLLVREYDPAQVDHAGTSNNVDMPVVETRIRRQLLLNLADENHIRARIGGALRRCEAGRQQHEKGADQPVGYEPRRIAMG